MLGHVVTRRNASVSKDFSFCYDVSLAVMFRVSTLADPSAPLYQLDQLMK